MKDFWKKKLEEMLIEQIFEFKFRGPWTPFRSIIPKTGYFHDKRKIS